MSHYLWIRDALVWSLGEAVCTWCTCAAQSRSDESIRAPSTADTGKRALDMFALAGNGWKKRSSLKVMVPEVEKVQVRTVNVWSTFRTMGTLVLSTLHNRSTLWYHFFKTILSFGLLADFLLQVFQCLCFDVNAFALLSDGGVFCRICMATIFTWALMALMIFHPAQTDN